jgi:hypothetical protein
MTSRTVAAFALRAAAMTLRKKSSRKPDVRGVGAASQSASSARPASVISYSTLSGFTDCATRWEITRSSRESRSRTWYRWPMFNGPHCGPTAASNAPFSE